MRIGLVRHALLLWRKNWTLRATLARNQKANSATGSAFFPFTTIALVTMSYQTDIEDANPWAATTSRATPPPLPGSSLDQAIVVDDPPETAPPPYSDPQHGFTSSSRPDTGHVHHTGMENTDQVLLLVFIHGFKGSSETTFEDFPSRLTHNLQETYPGLHVKSLVYPTYDTRGSLAAAVAAFVEWLTMQTVMLEDRLKLDPDTSAIRPDPTATIGGGGAGSVKIVLAGHSMGGLIAVDAALSIARKTSEQQQPTHAKRKLWPAVVGVLAYDTPYYGVHPGVFKHGINKYAGYIQTAQNIGTFLAPMGVGLAARWNSERQSQSSSATPPSNTTSAANGRSSRTTESNGNDAAASARASSNWRTALMATGAVALASGAAASAAYFNKDKINGAYGWVSDHLAFVSNLWDDSALRARLDQLVEQPQILFHCYYTRLPASSRAANPTAQAQARDRTFIILPPRDARSAPSFTPMDNVQAADEVEAHISMFNARANPRYFELGLQTSRLVATCLDNESRFGDQTHAQHETETGRGDMDEEKGLRFGDDEIEQLRHAERPT